MSEQLIIRLGSQPGDPIPWLVWSPTAREVIASGELGGSEQLPLLQERAGGRSILILVPSVDVTLRSVNLPGKPTRQLLQALPFMLEEELCQDVEQLHVALLGVEAELAHVAVVAHARMAQWLAWLEHAGLKPQRVLPDVLAMPVPDDHWQALELEGQWLIRTGAFSGLSIEADWLATTLEQIGAAGQPILSHSTVPADVPGEWHEQLTELPMQLLAEGALASRWSLLSGPYQPTNEWRKYIKPLLWGGGMAAACILLLLGNRWMEIRQQEALAQQLDQQSRAIYRRVFPEERRVVNLRAQMERHVAALSSSDQPQGLLMMLTQLQPVFRNVSDFKPSSLRYDASRGELRIQAIADSFQSFERLQGAAPEGIVIEQGALTQQGEQVSGTVTFRRAAS